MPLLALDRAIPRADRTFRGIESELSIYLCVNEFELTNNLDRRAKE